MQEIVNAANTSEVHKLLRIIFGNQNIEFKLGICTVIHHRIILSSEHDNVPKNLTTYLMLPGHKGGIMGIDLLKVVSLGRYLGEDYK